MHKIKIKNNSISINSIKQLKLLAEYLLKIYGSKKIWLFEGDMGTGKTTLIKELCILLGANENVSSPSYSLINEYTISDDKIVYHFDLYRLENINQIDNLGLDDYLYSGNYCFIEWGNKLKDINISDFLYLKIVNEGHNKRTFYLNT